MIEYEIIRSKRKTMSLTIDNNLNTVVRVPLKMPLNNIEAFVYKHLVWIEKHRISMSERIERQRSFILNDDAIAELKHKAKAILPQKVGHYQRIMGVVSTGIKITSAKTRWGSCSGKNSLCFSYLLMLLPEDIIDYIVVHELAHIRVKNHSTMFYNEVAKYMPDYRERLKKLKRTQRELPL